jgi:hypothetical protein
MKLESRNSWEGSFKMLVLLRVAVGGARTLVDAVVNEGRIDWANSTETEIDLESFDIEISRQCKEPRLEGVWYVGPKFLYEADQGQT